MSARAEVSRLTAGLEGSERLSLDEHLGVHGPLPAAAGDPDTVIRAVAASGLRGRGGGAFPTATKLSAVTRARGRSVVVANGSEGEPMSRKDRALLEAMPHLVLDGAVVAAQAVGAREVIVTMPEDAMRALGSMRAARAERRDATRVSLELVPRHYLAGEESALVRFLDGGPLKPRVVPPRPFERGIGGRPTLMQNVETLAHLALIARHGGAWFRSLGTAEAPGTALVTLNGAVARPGVYETATGTRLGDLLASAGGTTEPVRAVLAGGYFGSWLPGEGCSDLQLDAAGAGARRAAIGSGVLVVLGESACAAAEVARSTAWLAGQTAGQCGPCVHGLAALADGIGRLVAGRADDGVHARLLRWGAQVEGRGACHHPNGAVRYLRSALEVFAAELEDHHRHGPCEACASAPVLVTPRVEAIAA